MNISVWCKNILCFGDSITWWRIPIVTERYKKNERWTGILQSELWSDFNIIEEGLRWRSVYWENPKFSWRNGSSYRYPCLLSHFPLDLVIIFLWTNDLQKELNHSIQDIVTNLRFYNDLLIQASNEFKITCPKVLLVSPPYIDSELLKEWSLFPMNAWELSLDFGREYSLLAEELWWKFFDAWAEIWSWKWDWVHLDIDQNVQLWKLLKEKLLTII